MDKDINRMFEKLTEALRLCGSKHIKSIRYVNDWYKIPPDDREYVKEVAEIEFDDGYKKYVDIGGDSNLAAIYDVVSVLLQFKEPSAAIQRIEVPDGY